MKKFVVSLLAATLSVSPAFAAESRDLSLRGEINIKLHQEGNEIRITAGNLDGARLRKGESGVELFTRDNQLLGKCVKSVLGKSELQDRNGSALASLTPNDAGYKLLNPKGETLNRVKIKEDKFNIYDPQDNRLRHGKQKPDGYGVKTETDEQVLKIKGATSLEDASYFALPIQEEQRILLWACR